MADLITPQRIQLNMFAFYLAQEQSAFTISAFTLPSAIQWAIFSVEQVYASIVIRMLGHLQGHSCLQYKIWQCRCGLM